MLVATLGLKTKSKKKKREREIIEVIGYIQK